MLCLLTILQTCSPYELRSRFSFSGVCVHVKGRVNMVDAERFSTLILFGNILFKFFNKLEKQLVFGGYLDMFYSD